jgi:hypothetical protein
MRISFLEHILLKLGVHSRAQAVALALQQQVRDAESLALSSLDALAPHRAMN